MQNRTQILENDRRHLWHPYTKISGLDENLPVIEKAQGIYLYDVDGTQYTDAISSWWACSLGHSNQRITRAIVDQGKKLQHCILGNMTHPGAVELAQKLAKLMPTPDRHVFFSSDGSSSIEAALKMSVQYWHNKGLPEKNRFISLNNAYHGDTLACVAVGYLEHFHKPFKSALIDVTRTDAAYESATEEANLAKLQKTLEQNPGQFAALIVEPLCQGSAGMLMYSAGFLKKLSQLCDRHNVLLIDDEIAMGFGRTGKMFAFEHAGIDPDIVCVGKGLTSGYLPVSAAIAKDHIYETFTDTPSDNTFYHGHTFGGNPIGIACALEVMKIYEEEDIVGHTQKMSSILKEKLDTIKTSNPGIVEQTRVLGLLGAVKLNDDHQKGYPLMRKIRDRLLQNHILVRPLGDIIYLMPPLTITGQELEELTSQLATAITGVNEND